MPDEHSQPQPTEDLDLYAYLGRMVRFAADLELRLHFVASHLCESPYTAFWVNGESSSRTTKLIGDVARVTPGIPPTDLATLNEILKRCNQLFQRRHAYVHGAWSVDQSGDEPVLQTMRLTRGQQVPRFEDLSKDDLSELTRGLDAATDDLIGWLSRKMRNFPPA